jgi:hypothetical protein
MRLISQGRQSVCTVDIGSFADKSGAPSISCYYVVRHIGGDGIVHGCSLDIIQRQDKPVTRLGVPGTPP